MKVQSEPRPHRVKSVCSSQSSKTKSVFIKDQRAAQEKTEEMENDLQPRRFHTETKAQCKLIWTLPPLRSLCGFLFAISFGLKDEFSCLLWNNNQVRERLSTHGSPYTVYLVLCSFQYKIWKLSVCPILNFQIQSVRAENSVAALHTGHSWRLLLTQHITYFTTKNK